MKKDEDMVAMKALIEKEINQRFKLENKILELEKAGDNLIESMDRIIKSGRELMWSLFFFGLVIGILIGLIIRSILN